MPLRGEDVAEMVQEFPAVYDKRHKGYKDLTVKENVWKKVAEKMNAEETTEGLVYTHEDARTKFISFRSKLGRKLKVYRDSLRSGAGASDLPDWYKKYAWLADHISSGGSQEHRKDNEVRIIYPLLKLLFVSDTVTIGTNISY